MKRALLILGCVMLFFAAGCVLFFGFLAPFTSPVT